ncbi:hypothetical protein ONZ43_g417 [Nemania bipapillata]|uniref:Uncharacterized protein n=1 Tax=Nemania bipapillata TaxID=110536 RepID=A0ACC2J8F7_9PEZI|nr:hypothetical protein ONZ43_g417 [Nemania bipapillata]
MKRRADDGLVGLLGQLGRVAVIGGSEDYTGAPYFSAMASARLGCDMSHVICTPAASAVIKTYSPNLMVHPLMRQSSSSSSSSDEGDADTIARPIIDLLARLHVLVIGPGLGRDPLMHATCARVLAAARTRGMPVVLDADALALVTATPSLVAGWREVVLTPNVVEFARLWKGVFPDREKGEYLRTYADPGWRNESLRVQSVLSSRDRYVVAGDEMTGAPGQNAEGRVWAWDFMTGELKATVRVPWGPAGLEPKKIIGKDGKEKERTNVISCVAWRMGGDEDEFSVSGTSGVVTVFGCS